MHQLNVYIREQTSRTSQRNPSRIPSPVLADVASICQFRFSTISVNFISDDNCSADKAPIMSCLFASINKEAPANFSVLRTLLSSEIPSANLL